MKKIIYSKNDIKDLQGIFKKLFPKIKHIKVYKKGGMILIKFSITRWWIWRKILPGLTSNTVPLYELLFTQVPRQLSYRKSNGYSYSSSYSLQLLYVADRAPEFMCKVLKEMIEEISPAIGTTLSDIREGIQDIEEEGLKDESSLLKKIQIFVSPEDDGIISSLISTVRQYRI